MVSRGVRSGNKLVRDSWPGDDQMSVSLLISSASEAQERTHESAATMTKAVGVFSTVRRNRYHHEEMIRRTSLPAMSPRSRNTSPKPPPCRRRSVALNACSTFAEQRTQSSWSKSNSVPAAETGSKTSLVSINAHTSLCVAARESTESIKLVRPEDGGPKISVTAPRGSPPIIESTSSIPVGINFPAAFAG